MVITKTKTAGIIENNFVLFKPAKGQFFVKIRSGQQAKLNTHDDNYLILKKHTKYSNYPIKTAH